MSLIKEDDQLPLPPHATKRGLSDSEDNGGKQDAATTCGKTSTHTKRTKTWKATSGVDLDGIQTRPTPPSSVPGHFTSDDFNKKEWSKVQDERPFLS
jgi:hypothetical protein